MNVVKRDAGAPSVSLDDPGTSLNGTTSLGAIAADSESGVACVQFQRSPAGAGSWTTVSTDTTSPFGASFDTTAVADGLYDLRAVATDAAGNQTLSGLATDRRVDDSTRPDLHRPRRRRPRLGARSRSRQPRTTRAPASPGSRSTTRSGAGTWTTWATQTTGPFAYTWDSTSVTDGTAEIQVLARDALGNESSVTRSVIVDNDAPTGSLTVPGSGSTFSNTLVHLVVSASDAAPALPRSPSSSARPAAPGPILPPT